MNSLRCWPMKWVDCRAGSLEKHIPWNQDSVRVDCRAGSLEMVMCHGVRDFGVDCRAGSLETDPAPAGDVPLS